MGFGTGIVPAGWGFTLQNRGANFSLDPAHPNALAPRKRPYHTIIPGMMTRDLKHPERTLSDPELAEGESKRESKDAAESKVTLPQELFAPFGVMGGFMQPQGHLQVVVGMIDDGLDPQSALGRLRFCLTEARPSSDVQLEEGIPAETMAELAEMGHKVIPVSDYPRLPFGFGQIIRRDPDGVLWGGSDPRADGCAVGL